MASTAGAANAFSFQPLIHQLRAALAQMQESAAAAAPAGSATGAAPGGGAGGGAGAGAGTATGTDGTDAVGDAAAATETDTTATTAATTAATATGEATTTATTAAGDAAAPATAATTTAGGGFAQGDFVADNNIASVLAQLMNEFSDERGAPPAAKSAGELCSVPRFPHLCAQGCTLAAHTPPPTLQPVDALRTIKVDDMAAIPKDVGLRVPGQRREVCQRQRTRGTAWYTYTVLTCGAGCGASDGCHPCLLWATCAH